MYRMEDAATLYRFHAAVKIGLFVHTTRVSFFLIFLLPWTSLLPLSQ